jgi:DNA polymerase-3 subunit epsilon/oligoribonuclease
MLGIFLDIETTGLNPRKHRSLEIAFRVLNLPSMETRASYESIVSQPKAVWETSDADSLKINGFQWEQLKNGKPEPHISEEVIALFNQLQIRRKRAVFICQNPSFDRAFFAQLIDIDLQERLQWPYHWLDLASMHLARLHLCGGIEDCEEMNLSKNNIAEYYNLPPEEQPHRAMHGVDHLIACYQAIMKPLQISTAL